MAAPLPPEVPPSGGFFPGLQMMAAGLADSAARASFSVGLGAGGLGGTLWLLDVQKQFAVVSLALAAFFICAKIGILIDRKVDNQAKNDANAERFIAELRRQREAPTSSSPILEKVDGGPILPNSGKSALVNEVPPDQLPLDVKGEGDPA